jgi:hypothetical protein
MRKIKWFAVVVVGGLSVFAAVDSVANAQLSRAPEPGRASLAYVPEGLVLQPETTGVSFDDIDQAFVYTARNKRSVFIVATGFEYGNKNGNRCNSKIPAGVSSKRVSVRVNGTKSDALYLKGAKLNKFLLPETAIAKPTQPYPLAPISALLNCGEGNELAISLGTILSPEALARRVENTIKVDPTLVMTEWHASSNVDRQKLAWLGDNKSVTVETFWDQRPAEGVVFFSPKQTQVAGIPASIEQNENCTTLEWLAQPGARVRLQGCRIPADRLYKMAEGVKFAPLG